jgi:hypothetical protein
MKLGEPFKILKGKLLGKLHIPDLINQSGLIKYKNGKKDRQK